MTSRPDIKMPYDIHGNLKEYAGYGDIVWRDNVPFEATMEVVGYERGRSAVRVILRDEGHRKFPVFISDLVDLIMTSEVHDGKVSGTWMGTKKGSNYGLKKVSG